MSLSTPTIRQRRSYPQIGSIVGCSENTVKTRMFLARRRLAQLLSHLELESARAYAS